MPRRPRKHMRKKIRFNAKKNKKKLEFEDPEIKKRWDKDKSPHQNYLNLGLKLDPNATNAPAKDPVEFNVPEPAPRPKDKRMTKMEELYYKALVDKHGTNFKAMARDIKLNYNQLTETKLERRALFYIEAYRKPDEDHKRKRAEFLAGGKSNNNNKKNDAEEEDDDDDDDDEDEDDDDDEEDGGEEDGDEEEEEEDGEDEDEDGDE